MSKNSFVDTPAIVQVIGCIYNNPHILDEKEKYNFIEFDFPEEFHRILFGSIYNLYTLGASQITYNQIEDYLSSREKSYAIYMKNRGREYLNTISEKAQLASFPYYYNRMKKMSLLRMYSQNLGIDLKWLYDPSNILDVKKKQAQEDWLDNASLSDIISAIETKIDKVRLQFAGVGEDLDSTQAGANILDLLEKYKETPEIGSPLYGKYINTVTKGARLKKVYLRSAPTGVGKAIPNDVLIPTPNGLRRVGDIKEGDYIFSRKGEPTRVKKVYPQQKLKEIWKVTFLDGRVATCCEDHLWEYYYNSHHDWRYRVDTIKAIYERTKKYQNPYKYNFQRWRFSIRMTGPVQYPHKDIPIDLYEWGLNYPADNSDGIPREYLEGDIEQRTQLLQGLLDAYGYLGKYGHIMFEVNNDRLLSDVAELCYSFGFFAKKETDGQTCPSLTIECKRELKHTLFRKKEKVQKAYDFEQSRRRNFFLEHLPIVDITPTTEVTEMTCFKVENEEHLFLMNDYIVTHNTRAMVGDACYLACDEIFDLQQNKWVKNGVKEPTVFITTEQEIDEVQTMMLSFLSGVDENYILLGNYPSKAEENRVIYAARLIENSPLYIKELPDFSLEDVENTIKYQIHKNDIKYVVFDYIHSSMKILNEVSSKAGIKNLREDNVLFMIGVKLKDIANQYGVFILTATQLNGSWQDAKELNQNLLRGAKSLGDKIDAGMIMVEVTQSDLEALEKILKDCSFEKPNIKISVYKNRRGKYKNIFLWCKANRGVCRIDPIFVTDWNYQLLNVEDTLILVNDN